MKIDGLGRKSLVEVDGLDPSAGQPMGTMGLSRISYTMALFVHVINFLRVFRNAFLEMPNFRFSIFYGSLFI